MTSQGSRNFLVVVVVIVLAVLAAAVMNMPDNRTSGQKMGQAIDRVSDGDLKGAGRALENRTPGDRISDAAKDIKKDVTH